MNYLIQSSAKRKTAIASIHFYKPELDDIQQENNITEALENAWKLELNHSIALSDKICTGNYSLFNLKKALLPLQIFSASFSGVKPIQIKLKLTGGGLNAQVEALRLAIAKGLVKVLEERKDLLVPFKSALRQQGLLTSDSRVVERNKPGLKKARKPQAFNKR